MKRAGRTAGRRQRQGLYAHDPNVPVGTDSDNGTSGLAMKAANTIQRGSITLLKIVTMWPASMG